MTHRKLTVLIGALAALAAALFASQAGGVLAAWQSAVWGGTQFGRGEYTEGYTRAVAAHGSINGRAVSAAYAEHTHENPGSTITGWQDDSTTAVIGINSLKVSGNVTASHDPTGSADNTIAKAEIKDLALKLTNLSLGPRVKTTGTLMASAWCPLDGSRPLAIAARGGTVEVADHTIAIPSANSSTPIDLNFLDPMLGQRRVRGELITTVTTTSQSAGSALRLVATETDILGFEKWTMDIELVRAECGIDVPMPAFGSAVTSAPSSLSDEPDAEEPDEFTIEALDDEDSSEGDVEQADTGETDPEAADSEGAVVEPDVADEKLSDAQAAEAEAKALGPQAPVDVALNVPFDVIATDGTKLGRATIHEVDASTPAPGDPVTVAVRMTVDTTDHDGESRLSTLAADSFRQLVGGTPSPVQTVATTRGPVLPASVQPGTSSTGWVTFTTQPDTGSAAWQPAGTSGFTFALPAPTTPNPPPVTNPETPQVPDQPGDPDGPDPGTPDPEPDEPDVEEPEADTETETETDTKPSTS